MTMTLMTAFSNVTNNLIRQAFNEGFDPLMNYLGIELEAAHEAMFIVCVIAVGSWGVRKVMTLWKKRSM